MEKRRGTGRGEREGGGGEGGEGDPGTEDKGSAFLGPEPRCPAVTQKEPQVWKAVTWVETGGAQQEAGMGKDGEFWLRVGPA